MEKVERFQSELSNFRASDDRVATLATAPNAAPHGPDNVDLLTQLTLNLCNVAQLASALESQNAELGAEMGRLVERVRQLELEKLALSDHLAACQSHPLKTGIAAAALSAAHAVAAPPPPLPFQQRAEGNAIAGAGTGSARAKLQRRVGGSVRIRRNDHSPFSMQRAPRQRVDSGGAADRFLQLAADARKSMQHVSTLDAPPDTAIKRASSGDVTIKGSAHSIPECLYASDNVCAAAASDAPQVVPKRLQEAAPKSASVRSSAQEMSASSVRSSAIVEKRGGSQRVSVASSARNSANPVSGASQPQQTVQFAPAIVDLAAARAEGSGSGTPTRQSLQAHSESSRHSAKSDPTTSLASSADVIVEGEPLALPLSGQQVPASSSTAASTPSAHSPPPGAGAQSLPPPARKKSAATSSSKWKGKRPFRLVRQLFRHSTTSHAKVHLVRDAAGATHKCDAEAHQSAAEVRRVASTGSLVYCTCTLHTRRLR